MNYIRKADLYKLIANLKQNWGLDKNEYNLDIISLCRSRGIQVGEVPFESSGLRLSLIHIFFQQVQEPPELFLEIYIPLSVTKLLNAVLLVLVTQLGNAEHLRPVRRVNDQCAAELRVLPYICLLYTSRCV